jgi:hypothetical protein
MPLLASLLTALFGKVFDFFSAYFARTIALRLSVGALVVASFTVLYQLVYSSVSLLSLSVPVTLAEVFAFVLPGNVDACITAVLTTEAAILGFNLWTLSIGASKRLGY